MQKNRSQNRLTLCQIIEQTGLSKSDLAAKMEMPYGTFKNKLNDSQPTFRFRPEEEQKLIKTLKDIATLIQSQLWSN